MRTGHWVFIIGILLAIIVVLAWILFATPAQVEAPTTPATSTSPVTTPTTTPPLHERVTVTSPQSGADVEKMFIVSGSAPGQWFFEASFPVQVRDPEGNVLGRAVAQAQGEWMTEKLVTFVATMRVEKTYSGPATLILMRDNPSGLPENDDALEVPIVIR